MEESKRLVEEKAGQLAQSSRYKSEFIANMSHELRTPLNSLLVLAEQLEDNTSNTMTPLQVEYASVIRASGNDLLVLLNGILDLAKVESGTINIEKSDVYLSDVARSLRREFDLVAQSKGLAFSVDVASGCPARLVTDPQRLRQIMINLLANAFKFTERGGVHVSIGLAERGWSPHKIALAHAPAVVRLTVTDTGIGIDDADQLRIFDEFAQGDGTTARSYGGTGLGLSISRDLVELLGGEIVVHSVLHEGSAFAVYLPAERPAPTLAPLPALPAPESLTESQRRDLVTRAADPALRPPDREGMAGDHPRSDEAGPRPLRGYKALVVDDDFRNIFAMTALLERNAVEVLAAESGPEAIGMLEQMLDVNIVLMDIMMPNMDGYATIRAIRSVERNRHLPIIAVTGKVVGGERQRCLDAGANDYVPKPVNSAELLSVLAPWLEAGASGATR